MPSLKEGRGIALEIAPVFQTTIIPWNNGMHEEGVIDTLEQPSGKFDYHVRYSPPHEEERSIEGIIETFNEDVVCAVLACEETGPSRSSANPSELGSFFLE